MSIQNYLNQIKNAIFGKDIRQAIYDAIKQCYDDASINNDNANMEVKLARGIYQTLKDRLNNNEENIKNNSSKIEEKADKITTQSIQQQVNNLVLGAVGDGNNAEVIQARGSYALLNERLNAEEKILQEARALLLYKNVYNEYRISSTLGNKTKEQVTTEGPNGYINVEVQYDESSGSRIVEFFGDYKIKDVEEINITVLSETSASFVSLGLGFNWSMMKTVSLDKGVEKTVTLKPSDIPQGQPNNIIRIGFGTYNGSLTKGKFKFEIKYKSTNTSSLADKSRKSDYATSALSTTNAGVIPININNIYETQDGLLKEKDKDNNIILTNTCLNTNDYFWCGYHIQINFDDIKELDSNFALNFKQISGVRPNRMYILKSRVDWNPSAEPIGVDLLSASQYVNLYELIEKSGYLEKFKVLKSIFILVGVQPNTSINNNPFVWSIKPVLENRNSLVFATNYSKRLKEETKELINNFVYENNTMFPIGVKIVPINNFLVRNDNNNLYKINNLSNGWINVKKESTELGTAYAGVYAKFTYDNINDLDGDFIIRYKHNKGVQPNTKILLYDVTDWGNSATSGTIYIGENIKYNLKSLLTSDSSKTYSTRKYFYICMVHYNSSGVSDIMDFDIRIDFIPKNKNVVIATELDENYRKNLIDEVSSEVNGYNNYITCWGDSLTAGGGWTTRLGELLGLPVFNGGTGGENSLCIMARQGGDSMIVNNITIPATTDPVLIASRSVDGGIPTQINGAKVTPLLQGGAHVNPCYIGDIKGTLKWTGSSYADMEGTWTFTRAEAGEQVIINRPTSIRTDFDINRNAPKLMVIFIGQNGGWSNLDDLVNQHKMMINHSNAKNVIILGLSSGSKAERAEYETRMKKEFGRYFISLREYLSTYGLADAGIEPTETDKQMMAEGKTPQSLLSDTVHYNTQCKTVIGNMLAKKVKDLNIV